MAFTESNHYLGRHACSLELFWGEINIAALCATLSSCLGLSLSQGSQGIVQVLLALMVQLSQEFRVFKMHKGINGPLISLVKRTDIYRTWVCLLLGCDFHGLTNCMLNII